MSSHREGGGVRGWVVLEYSIVFLEGEDEFPNRVDLLALFSVLKLRVLRVRAIVWI